jgi:hypothetical protein
MSMTDNTQKTDGAERPTATIYQFPLGGRRAYARELEAPRYLAAASGDSWYHQDAIDEEKKH